VSTWDPDPISAMLGEKVGERTSTSLLLPLNCYLNSITSTTNNQGQPFWSAVVEYQDGRVEEIVDPGWPDIGSYKILFPKFVGSDSTPFWDVVQIRLKKTDSASDFAGDVELKLEFSWMGRDGFPKPQGAGRAELKYFVNISASDKEPVVLEFTRTVTGRE